MPVMPSRSASVAGRGARRPRAASRRRRRCRRERPALRRARRATRAAPRTSSAPRRRQVGRARPPCGARARAPAAPARGAAAPSRSPRSTVGRGIGQRERAVLALAASSPWARSWRTTPRHCCSLRSAPMPQTCERVVAVLRRRAAVLLAAQDVDQVAGAEALVALALQPHDRREQLLRRRPCRPRSRAA